MRHSDVRRHWEDAPFIREAVQCMQEQSVILRDAWYVLPVMTICSTVVVGLYYMSLVYRMIFRSALCQ